MQGDRRHKREEGQTGDSYVQEFILVLLLILSEAEDGWGTGDRDGVSAGCTGVEVHVRVGLHQ